MPRTVTTLAALLLPALALAASLAADAPPYVDVPVGNGVVRYVPQPVAPRPATLPVVTPPPLARRVAPASGDRGDGVVNRGLRSAAWTVADTLVDGYEQNIAVENFAGPVTLANVLSVNAYRGKAADVYKGQGLYLDRCGPVTVAGCLFGWNGWQPGKPDNNRTGFRHGIYQNIGAGPLDVSDSIFVGNPGAGVQIRAGATLRRCVFVGNGIGVLAVRGSVVLEDCAWVGGHPYANLDADGKVKSWSGNSAVFAYTDVTMRDCLILGTPGQGDKIGTTPTYCNGPVAVGTGHRDNPGVTGTIKCVNSRIVGWPKASPGFIQPVVPGLVIGGEPINYDPLPHIRRAMAKDITVAQASEIIRSEARALAR